MCDSVALWMRYACDVQCVLCLLMPASAPFHIYPPVARQRRMTSIPGTGRLHGPHVTRRLGSSSACQRHGRQSPVRSRPCSWSACPARQPRSQPSVRQGRLRRNQYDFAAADAALEACGAKVSARYAAKPQAGTPGRPGPAAADLASGAAGAAGALAAGLEAPELEPEHAGPADEPPAKRVRVEAGACAAAEARNGRPAQPSASPAGGPVAAAAAAAERAAAPACNGHAQPGASAHRANGVCPGNGAAAGAGGAGAGHAAAGGTLLGDARAPAGAPGGGEGCMDADGGSDAAEAGRAPAAAGAEAAPALVYDAARSAR